MCILRIWRISLLWTRCILISCHSQCLHGRVCRPWRRERGQWLRLNVLHRLDLGSNKRIGYIEGLNIVYIIYHMLSVQISFTAESNFLCTLQWKKCTKVLIQGAKINGYELPSRYLASIWSYLALLARHRHYRILRKHDSEPEWLPNQHKYRHTSLILSFCGLQAPKAVV